MLNSKKIKIALISSVLGVSLLTLGTFAIFTDYTQSEIKAKVGSLNINVENIELTNKETIHPGDGIPGIDRTYTPVPGDPLYDENNPEKTVEAPTTEHKLSYTITNTGNIAAKIRSCIFISCDKNTPTVFHIYNENGEELSKVYINENNEIFNDLSSLKGNLKYIKYIIEEEPLNGDDENQIITDKKTEIVEYFLGMDKTESNNNFQNTNVLINVQVEAIQYNYSDDNDWSIFMNDNPQISATVST